MTVHTERTPTYQSYPIFGRTLRKRTIAGFVLAESVYEGRLKIPHHVHEENGGFNIVLHGGFAEYSQRRSEIFNQAALSFHPPGDAHANEFQRKRTRLFNVWFSSAWFDRVCADLEGFASSGCYQGSHIGQLTLKLYREFHSCDCVTPLAVEGIVLEMLAAISREQKYQLNECRTPSWLKASREFIDATFTQNISIAELSHAAGVHPVHFSRVFRRCVGCGVGDYVRSKRIQFARKRLCESDIPLAQIGTEAGFCDQSHFARTFKKATGLTPRRYRTESGAG
jgi:AraC family transcriptional regulator